MLGGPGGVGMEARTSYATKRVGALPLLAGFLEDLKIGEIVDEVVPWEGTVPWGPWWRFWFSAAC